MPEVAKAISLDLWICDHYKVLPTEDRFKQLSDRQKYLLWLGFVDQAPDEHLHASYQAGRSTSFGETDKKNLRGLGYTPEQLLRMQKELEKAQADG